MFHKHLSIGFFTLQTLLPLHLFDLQASTLGTTIFHK